MHLRSSRIPEPSRWWALFRNKPILPSLSSHAPSESNSNAKDITPSTGDEETGLFNCPEFSTVEGFVIETRKCIETSRKLAQAITVKADNASMSIINNMDLLSDELCRVADLAECIRQVHPNPDFASAAQDACIAINSYVEKLNTDVGLYKALRKFMNSDEFSSQDEVTKRTAESFMHDFEINGIHLEDSIRKKIVKLNDFLLEIGYKFSLNALDPNLVSSSDCMPSLRECYAENGNNIQVDYVPYESLKSETRKNGYLLYYASDDKKMKIFEDMISNRQNLAQLVGDPSFSHRVLKMSMAERPEVVMEFLERLSEKILPLAREDVDLMRNFQRKNQELFQDNVDVNPWDIPLLTSEAQQYFIPDETTAVIKEWFPLHACIEGLGKLFHLLFGIHLELLPVKKGEVWHPSVYKFGFFDEGGHLLGYTYADLFYRSNKLASDCHFTIRGGREVIGENKGNKESSSYYQTPIITLSYSFELPPKNKEILLVRHSVETLFHEMGHALHSMLGRAKYQNVTGTRCATDFAEVPSTLMELFLKDERVLSTFAKHYKTNKILPERLMKRFKTSSHFFAAYDTQMQISNAILDQKFHSDIHFPSNKTGWSEGIYKDTAIQYSPLGYVPDTALYLRFTHLCAYGGRYYSYLWARAVASLIWNSSFAENPFSRDSGDKYRTMLSYGGGIKPNLLVRDMLGFEPTVEQLVNALYNDILKQREEIRN